MAGIFYSSRRTVYLQKKTLKLLVLSETVLVSIGKEGWGLGGGGGRREGGK